MFCPNVNVDIFNRLQKKKERMLYTTFNTNYSTTPTIKTIKSALFILDYF